MQSAGCLCSQLYSSTTSPVHVSTSSPRSCLPSTTNCIISCTTKALPTSFACFLRLWFHPLPTLKPFSFSSPYFFPLSGVNLKLNLSGRNYKTLFLLALSILAKSLPDNISEWGAALQLLCWGRAKLHTGYSGC